MKTKMILILILLKVLSACDNSTKNNDDGSPYAGEPLFPGNYLFIHPDTIDLIDNDTISILINMKQQPFKLKGTLRIAIGGLKSSEPTLKLIYPVVTTIDDTNISSNRSRFIINVDFSNNKDTFYELKLVVDSVWAEKSHLISYGVGIETNLTIDSIFIDADYLYFPGELGKELPPVPIPEKRWYNCSFEGLNHPDHDLLLSYFFYQNYSYRNSVFYFRRRR